MRPLLPSFIMIAYVYFTLVRGLPWRPVFKRLTTLLLVFVGLKYVFYVLASNDFSVPALPRWALQSMEVSYAAVLMLFVLLVMRDAVALLLRHIRPAWRMPCSRNAVGGYLAVLALCLAIWGTWQGSRVPDMRTQEVAIENLPAALDGLVIVQLSDTHIGPFLDKSWLRAVVDKTNALSPDIVVITGDIIDGSLAALEQSVAPLADLRAKFGVYGVTGNHEYHFNAPEWLPAFARLGIRMLSNEHFVLNVNGAEVVIAGVNDSTSFDFGDVVDKTQSSKQALEDALKGALKDAPDAVRILLRHRADATVNNVHLQLSGHTHGGVMLFMQPLVALLNGGLVSGLYTYDHGQIYVSPGTGVGNGFACRIGVPAEITRLVLRASTHAE